ncbi:hypothetical protein C4D60_Mb04t22730 [Musa balbisiana]|uniref:Uncharacterized protein n=1 Tax=Musa balbisiana TaxID=52838 RepID=A0A4S8KE09_MUSBA|nr:hypothetical protein C4D60_Mb04t22730 [Musa balbisiana]
MFPRCFTLPSSAGGLVESEEKQRSWTKWMETEMPHEVKPGGKETRPGDLGKKIDVLIGWSAGHDKLKTLSGGETGFLSADAFSTGCIRSFTQTTCSSRD